MRARIFISYRQVDAQFLVDQLVDFLEDYFGEGAIFRDVEDTPLASDFEKVMNQNLKTADVLIAVVTKEYFEGLSTSGTRRIDDPSDYVRHEIKMALHRNIPIVPFVVHPASMPRSEDLPEDIRDFHKRQAQTAYPGTGFGVSLLQLVEGLFELLPNADRRKKKQNLNDGSKIIASNRKFRKERKVQEEKLRRRQTLLVGFLSAISVVGVTGLLFWIFRGQLGPSTPEEIAGHSRETVAQTWTEADQLRLSKEIASLTGRTPLPRKTRLANHRTEPTLGFPDYSSFEILSDDRYWDLRGWREINDQVPESFIILTRRVRLLKVAAATEIRFEAKTDGDEVFIECLSHPDESVELVTSDPSFVGTRATKLRQLAVNVENVPVNEELTIVYSATYWNSMQNKDDRWLGAIGYPRADRLRVYILMPVGCPLNSYRLKVSPSFREESRDYAGPLRILEANDKSSLLWEVPTPEGNWVYTVLLDW